MSENGDRRGFNFGITEILAGISLLSALLSIYVNTTKLINDPDKWRFVPIAFFILYLFISFLAWKKSKENSFIHNLILIVAFLSTAGFCTWVGTWLIEDPPTQDSAVLLGVTYEAQGYDIRHVNLTTVSNDGIPVLPKQAFQFTEITISIPKTILGCEINMEFYADDQLIGYAVSKKFIEGIVTWVDKANPPEIIVDKDFVHSRFTNAWEIRPSWKNIRLALVKYCDSKKKEVTWTEMKINEKGTSWFFNPPYLNIASIVYSINDGPPLLLDLRRIATTSIGAGPGDKLTIIELWYHSSAEFDKISISAEMYLSDSSGNYDENSVAPRPSSLIHNGINKFSEFVPYTWIIPKDKNFLDINIYRSDGANMDYFLLPIGNQASSGIPINQ